MVKFYKNILKLKRYLFEIQWIVGVQCLYLYQVNRRFEKARAEKKPLYVCIYLIIIFQKQATELSQDQSKYKLFKNQITFFRSFDLSSSESHLFGYQINAVPK